MKKVLLLDTNYSAAPIYDYLVGKGYEVFVGGGNPNDFLARTAERYLQFDYSNVARTLEVVDSLQIRFVVPGCNDRSYLTCARINAERGLFGLDSIEATETINNKEKFRVLQQLVADRSKLFHAGDLTVVSQVINDFSVQGFNINDFRHMDFVYADAALQYQTGIAVFGSGTHDVIQSFN